MVQYIRLQGSFLSVTTSFKLILFKHVIRVSAWQGVQPPQWTLGLSQKSRYPKTPALVQTQRKRHYTSIRCSKLGLVRAGLGIMIFIKTSILKSMFFRPEIINAQYIISPSSSIIANL